jgi:hypothetical protein
VLNHFGGPVTQFATIVSVCGFVFLNLFSTSAWGSSEFKEVLVIADYSEQMQSRLLVCSLTLIDESTGKNRLYEFQLSKSFEGRETLMVEWDEDRITHIRAEPNFKGLDVSAQALLPSKQFANWNTSNLPYRAVFGDWIRAMVARPGRYIEIKLTDALWNAGPLDFLKDGYSIQASVYDWNGVYPSNYKTKSNLASGEEVLLPFVIESSGPSPDFDDEVLSPFSHVSDLQSRGDTFQAQVTCQSPRRPSN